MLLSLSDNLHKTLFRGETFGPHIHQRMDNQRIINDLLAEGQSDLTPAIQERMIDIITSKFRLLSI